MKSSISWSEVSPGKFDAATGLMTTQSILWVVSVSLAIMIPAVLVGVPSNLDLSNHFRFALPFYEAVMAGNLHPAWLAESNGGYGDPSFRFYPPGLYYLLTLARMVCGDWYAATLVSFSFLSVLSGLGIFFWVRQFLSETVAVWAAIFYAFIPYHVNQFYQALLLAEYAAAAVLPFAFAFVNRLSTRRRLIDVAGLALTYTALILTHLPLSIVGSLALLLYFSASAEKNFRRKAFLQFCGAIALGLVASSFYWARMVTELGWISINAPNSHSAIDYRNEFLFSTFSPDNLNVWWMNILLVLTLMMTAPAIVLFARQLGFARPLRAVTMLFAASIFMATPLSYPIWKVVPPLQLTQFPWRWLIIVSLTASIISATAMPYWTGLVENRQRIKRLVVFGMVLVSVSFTLSHTVREAKFLSRSQFDTMLVSLRGSDSVDLWYPQWTHRRPARMLYQADAGDRAVVINKWDPENRTFEVSSGEAAEVRIRTFYYPHWKASAKGKSLSTRPSEDGALLIAVPSEATTINLEFTESEISRLSRVLSFLAALGIVALGALGLRSRQVLLPINS